MPPSHVVVLDFDGTCTPKGASLWSLVDKVALTPQCAIKAKQMREQYLPQLNSGTLSPADEREWFLRSMDLYIESGLTWDQVKEALAGVPIRDGVTETLAMLSQRNIPVAIVSYGVRQFIERVLRNHSLGFKVISIFALDLYFNNGLMTGYAEKTTVLPDNKDYFSRYFAHQYEVPPERILAVGDSGGDKWLGHLKENRLGIAKDDAEKEKLLPFMGEVIVTESFEPARLWLDRKLSQ